MIRCCNKAHNDTVAEIHHHDSVAQVRLCNTVRLVDSVEETEHDRICLEHDEYERMRDFPYGDTDDFGYERFLETRYSEEFRADEEREAAMGMVSFEEAYRRAMV